MTHSAEARQNIREVLLHDLKKEPRAFRRLNGGRNSQVFRVDCADGSVLAAKVYFQSAQDRRVSDQLFDLRLRCLHDLAHDWISFGMHGGCIERVGAI